MQVGELADAFSMQMARNERVVAVGAPGGHPMPRIY